MRTITLIVCAFVLASCSTQSLLIPDEPYDASDPNRAPHLIEHGDIDYPDLAREVNIQGTVSVELSIDTSGKVTQVTILDRHFNYSAVYLRNGTLKQVKDIFDQPLIDFYMNCKFTPGYHNGIPVSGKIRTGMTFKLH